MIEKTYPTRSEWSPKGIKRMPNDALIAPKSSLRTFEVLVFLRLIVYVNRKNDHGALEGLTKVKGTSVDKCFLFVEKSWKSGLWHL